MASQETRCDEIKRYVIESESDSMAFINKKVSFPYARVMHALPRSL
jgi:hypothetical protein